MNKKIIILLILFGAYSAARGGIKPERFERSVFYDIMKNGDLDAVNNEIAIVNGTDIKGREGFEGALLMKKAGLLKKPKERLSSFKEGRIKLETALAADNENAELHFLRLIIEERAPKIVKYHADIENDKAIVIKNYKAMPPAVQHAILDYSKNSKVLHTEDF